LPQFLHKVFSLIVSSDFLQSENPEVLNRTLAVTSNLIIATGPVCKEHRHLLFKILLQLGSNPSMKSAMPKVDATLALLAKNCGL